MIDSANHLASLWQLLNLTEFKILSLKKPQMYSGGDVTGHQEQERYADAGHRNAQFALEWHFILEYRPIYHCIVHLSSCEEHTING